MNSTREFDFIIVGSGFGGSVSALRLAEKGYSVAVLEAGRRYRTEDFPRTNWNLGKYLWLPALRCFGILRITPLANMLVLSGSGVGGGSLGYANTLLEPPDAFYEDPQWNAIADWKAILTPHFATARRMLGSCRLTNPSPADKLVEKIAQDMGRSQTYRLQDVGVFLGEPEVTVPDPYFDGRGPERSGCTMCGGCRVGCRHNAKNTLDKNYLHLAEQLGVKIIPETRVDLVHERDGGGYRLEARRTSTWLPARSRSYYARQVVLSGGVLGTVDLLLKCRDTGSLSHLSPMLGARVRTNSEALMGVTARNDRVEYSEGVAITSSFYPDAFTHVEPVRYSPGSDAMNLLATLLVEEPRAWLRPWRWLAAVLRHPIDHLRVLIPFGWAKRSIILLVMQTFDNSVRVARKRKWYWPFGKGLVSRSEGRREKVPVFIPQAQKVTRALAAGMPGVAQTAVNEIFLDAGTTAHILGGCPIGVDPEHGVIDTQNRVYGHEGLFVVDGSMIPANLGVNPSLTITAMAENAMSHIPPRDERD